MIISSQFRSHTWPKLLLTNGNPVPMSWSWFLRQFWFLTVLVFLGTLSYLFISHFIFRTVKVEGPSMYPTLYDSGFYWLNRIAYVKNDPSQDDIVAVKDPRDNAIDVKRIIAMPGQTIHIKKGMVYIDGKLLREPYLTPGIRTYADDLSGNEFLRVGNNEYFVMGDNRNYSADSRIFGVVPRQNILGKVTCDSPLD